MKRLLLAALMLPLSAYAVTICTATTRGPDCRVFPDCQAPMVLNQAVGLCVPTSCPAGTSAFPRLGGGVDCRVLEPGEVPTCIAGYVWRNDLGRCDYPSANQSLNAQPSRCTMTVEWVGIDPQTAQIVSLTQEQQCHDGADLATARTQVMLLGGK